MTDFTPRQSAFIESFERRADYVPFLKRVIGWNLTAKGEHTTDPETLNLQYSLVKEELRELIHDGIIAHNPVEFLDAVCDLFVVSSYYAFISNLKTLERNEFSKRTKEQREEESLKFISDVIDVTANQDLMIVTIEELEEAVLDNSPYATANLVAHLMHMFDVDIQEAMEFVLSSNDSKMPDIKQLRHRLLNQITVSEGGLSSEQFKFTCLTDQEAVDLHADQLNEKYKGRYSGIYGTITPEGRVVFRNDEGKIVKPCTFFEPTEGLRSLLPEL